MHEPVAKPCLITNMRDAFGLLQLAARGWRLPDRTMAGAVLEEARGTCSQPISTDRR